jgi:glycerate kinase
MARILIASDSFKGSAKSSAVAAAISQGWASVRSEDDITELLLADGGDGTLDVILKYRPTVEKILSEVWGADSKSHHAYWLLLEDGIAVIELAQACGIIGLAELDPLGAHTYGLGALIAQAAVHPGVRKIYVALGGSASTDAGVGALMALGYIFTDVQGKSISLGGGELSSIVTINSDDVIVVPEVIALVDVKNTLLGPGGTAPVFGPQKGASADQILELNRGLETFYQIAGVKDSEGAGAAGGTAYGLNALLGAGIESGVEFLSKIANLQNAIATSDLVITGEGQLDETSFNGKVVGEVLTHARMQEIKIALCVGSKVVAFPEAVWSGISLTELVGSQEEAIANPEKYLFLAGAELAQRFSQ